MPGGIQAAVGADESGECRQDVGLALGGQIDHERGKIMRAGLQAPVEVARLVKVAVRRGRAPGRDAAARIGHEQRQAVRVLERAHRQSAARRPARPAPAQTGRP